MSAKIIHHLFKGLVPEEKNDFPKQKTLKNPIHCSGTGVHGGRKVSMWLLPAPSNTGIIFRRIDISGQQTLIPAKWENVVDTRLCTVIGHQNGVKIATIEHLMSALYGCNIDNVIIEIDGPEVPIMDGSAAPFVFLIECAGQIEQDAPRMAIEITKTITVENGKSWASLTPAPHFSVSFELNYENSPLAQQHLTLGLYQASFKSDISRARSFGFLHDWDKLRENGYALGASLDNAVVITGDKIMNDGGLRYEDEFVRHKILDCVGDLYLAGAPLIAHFTGVRSGHALNCALLKKLFEDTSAWHFRPANPPRHVQVLPWEHAGELAVAN